MRRVVAAAIVLSPAFALIPSAAQAATCRPVSSHFEIQIGAGFVTYAQRVRTRHVGCETARRVLRACGRSPYPPSRWRGRELRGLVRGQIRLVLTSGRRRIDFRSAQDAQLPCSNPIFPRRVGGASRGPFVLSPRGLNTLVVGTRRRAAERASGLDLRSLGLGCGRSYENKGIDVVFAGDGHDPIVSLVMIGDARVPTTAGLRVGDPVARIAEIYGAQATLVGDLSVSQGIDFLINPAAEPEYQYAIGTHAGLVGLIVAGRRGQTVADEYCA